MILFNFQTLFINRKEDIQIYGLLIRVFLCDNCMGNYKKNNKKTIKIEGLKYHFELPEEFNQSIYENVYLHAFKAVDSIIGDLNDIKELTTKARESVQLELPNIISFIGSRGVGKTSAMLSFMHALKKYNESSISNGFYKFQNRTLRFTCLDCIDGSLMEHGEDIFKTILAQIYQKFIDMEIKDELRKDSDFDFRKRELLSDLEKVYRSVCDMELIEQKSFMAGETYMNSLRSFSSSQKVRKQFEELINSFTELMKYKKYGNNEKVDAHYVVIAIDDLDLNIQNCFSMLEKIHRYCTVPNIIVLMTMDIRQILSIVIKHFYEITPKMNQLLTQQEDYIRKLSIDYIDKVFPFNFRIYMPKIKIDSNIIIDREGNDVKTTLLRKLYLRTGICFDSQGAKQHFYFPASFRELTAFYLMLNSMKKVNFLLFNCPLSKKAYVKRNLENDKEILNNNYSMLLSDLENRIALHKVILKDDEDFFQKFINQDVRKAMLSVKQYYYNCINKELENGDEIPSYGELIEIIYDLGRIEYEVYKPIVHCIIAYFSYSFSKIYVSEKIAILENDKSKIGNTKRLIGNNILLRWTDDLLPMNIIASLSSIGTEERGGGVNLLKRHFARFDGLRLDETLKVEIPDFKSKLPYREFDYTIFAKKIAQIELLSMFFVNFSNVKRDSCGDIVWHFKIREDYQQRYYIEFNYDSDLNTKNNTKKTTFIPTADFNILNIINNSMNASKELERIENALIECIVSYENYNEEETRKLKQALRSYSLKNKYKEWENNYGELSMPLPLWWFDFSYNILKRLRKTIKLQLQKTNRCPKYSDICNVYKCLLEQLEDQNKFYNSSYRDHKMNLNFAKIFKDCPGIKVFLDSNDYEDLYGKTIDEMFDTMLNYSITEE